MRTLLTLTLAAIVTVTVPLEAQWWRWFAPASTPTFLAATTRYLTPDGAGTEDGTSWSNACDEFTGSCAALTRGYTYYVADGTYSAYTIDDAVNGTQVIAVKKATASDHGTETGWLTSYGDGSSVFTGSGGTGAGITILTKYIDIYGITIDGGLSPASPTTGASPANIAFLRFFDVTSEWVFLIAQDVLFQGGSFGGYNPCLLEGPHDIFRIWDNGKDAASSRVTVDGVTIHDSTDQGDGCAGTSESGLHADCMQLLGGHDITIRRSIFYNCPTSGILGASFRDTLDGLVIENNFFQAVLTPGTALSFGGSIHGTNYIRHNTIRGGMSTGGSPGIINVVGNILTIGSCQNGVYDYNLFVGGTTCGTNTRTGTPSFVSEPSPGYLNGLIPDYRLTGSDTAAANLGNTASYPTNDIDGRIRFSGSAPDLGAYER